MSWYHHNTLLGAGDSGLRLLAIDLVASGLNHMPIFLNLDNLFHSLANVFNWVVLTFINMCNKYKHLLHMLLVITKFV